MSQLLSTALQPTIMDGSTTTMGIPKPWRSDVFPMAYLPSSSSSTTTSSSSNSSSSRVPRRMLIVTKGIVGCGKSTFTKKLITSMQTAYEEANDGWSLVIADEGTDKYAPRKALGEQPRQIVIDNLLRYQQQANETASAYLSGKGDSEERAIAKRDFVLIIDTCGDFDDIFGLDFTGWDQLIVWINFSTLENVSNYLAWAMRNVLQRQGHETLSVEKVGLQICFEIATKKASRHGLDSSSLSRYSNVSSLTSALEELREEADHYQAQVVDQFSVEENLKIVLSVLWGERG